jgi:diaminohydroxyphosphoribosylaminopyrimidine deaminase / 5-amino-6-(5-phosphoribosylamino)uracil reductase
MQGRRGRSGTPVPGDERGGRLMYSVDDYRYMAHALQLAAKGLFTTDPNPRVGCVLVKDGAMVGEGWHERAGGPHAEIVALERAGKQAQGATCYVTLEPCCHVGRTPPCVQTLIKAGVTRVVAAMRDPNPRVAGRGFEELGAAGVRVQSGLLQAQAEAINPGFVMRMRHGRPFVRCKLAMSLDGRTAMASGESNWITRSPARRDVQRLRARSSAIMAGIGTVLSDDPALTVRDMEIGRQPLRVVVDPHLSVPPSARMFQLAGRTIIATATHDPDVEEALASAGAEIVRLPGQGDTVDLHALMRYLAQQEVNEVLLETGATLSGAMLRANLIDELVIYMAPVLMGDGARGLFHLPGIDTLAQRLALQIRDIRAVGEDWRIVAVPKAAG